MANWKDLLQASGVPLEQSVRSIVRGLGIPRANELSFERLNEDGRPIIASADVFGMLSMEPFDVRLLIECKHRHDGTRWMFAPRRADSRERTTLSNVLNIETSFHPDLKIRGRDLLANVPLTPMNPGVEIKDKADEVSVRKALYQLRYGAHHLFLDYLGAMSDAVYAEFELIPVFVPILVTTAELWTLREEVGYHEVRGANALEDVAERRDTLLVYSPPDRLVLREFVAKVEALPDAAKERLIHLIETNRLRPSATVAALARRFARRPQFYYVTSLEGLNPLLNGLLDQLRGVKWEDKRPVDRDEAEDIEGTLDEPV